MEEMLHVVECKSLLRWPMKVWAIRSEVTMYCNIVEYAESIRFRFISHFSLMCVYCFKRRC
uniref:Ovule protein n=1 Tax=Ascaris lumbricoides TaxID=6252 RepID=A0A0M3ILJ6_ASCLU